MSLAIDEYIVSGDLPGLAPHCLAAGRRVHCPIAVVLATDLPDGRRVAICGKKYEKQLFC